MPKDKTDKLIAALKKSMGGPISRDRRKPGPHLGFANKRLADIFRAVAHSYPKAVLVKDDAWKETAEEHVRMGTMKCAIHSHGHTYRLTENGVYRAKLERLIEK
ncbi:MAG TPA: hypothetical protein VGG10_15130 [Rhizomicrobium sp.]|jgi:hypothetical protein